VGESSWSNVWAVKAIFNLFEIIFGLKVNYHKGQFISFNNSSRWNDKAAEALNCKLGSCPFIYLGLPVGDDHRKKFFWTSVIERVSNRLASWSAKNISLGGKVVLLKSVLTS
jgi:hypothetical protein